MPVMLLHRIQFLPRGNRLNIIRKETRLLAGVGMGNCLQVLAGNMISGIGEPVTDAALLVIVRGAATVVEMKMGKNDIRNIACFKTMGVERIQQAAVVVIQLVDLFKFFIELRAAAIVDKIRATAVFGSNEQ